jgi:hypothetical protein
MTSPNFRQLASTVLRVEAKRLEGLPADMTTIARAFSYQIAATFLEAISTEEALKKWAGKTCFKLSAKKAPRK